MKKENKNWKKRWNDNSWWGILMVIYFSVTLFLVNNKEKWKDINPKMYWIIFIVSSFWILCVGINFITMCILDDEKEKSK